MRASRNTRKRTRAGYDEDFDYQRRRHNTQNRTDFLRRKQAKDFFREANASIALALLNSANLYNPYIVSGTRDNKLGKALPIVGVKSVANSIRENVLRNRIHSEENAQRYDTAGLTV